MATTAKSETDKPGEIRADATYTLSEFQERMRLGSAAMRQARRQGLRVRQAGRNRYVLGSDWLAYLESDTN